MAREVDFLIRLNGRSSLKRSLEYYLEGASSAICPEKDELYKSRFSEFKEDLIDQFGPHHLTRHQQDYLFDYVNSKHGQSHYELYEGYRSLAEFLTGIHQVCNKD
ncbi:hypothetical protein [Sulfitobacter sp. R18_1]|uniref:hypothetical protein n=1 Tax=Sulfitobacter sp. R18_1 TaxID=2821104 RepID=UPI001ADB609E|nr:hypothetical protein [Sulfitobacter sp. R18_1]MBO9428357.1 hypothetical protein [Sulfitobacter sp. R18_1]